MDMIDIDKDLVEKIVRFMLKLPRAVRIRKIFEFLSCKQISVMDRSELSRTMVIGRLDDDIRYPSLPAEMAIYDEIMFALKILAPGFKPTFKQFFDKEAKAKAA